MIRAIRSLILCSVLLLTLIIGCSTRSPSPNPPDYWPTEEWRSGDPGDFGIDSAGLQSAVEKIPTEMPFLDSFLLIRNGYIVHESYYNGFDDATLHNIHSVTKSWTSALIGMARARGELSQLDAPLPELLPGYFDDGRYEDKQDIRLSDLLTMRSGIDFDDEKMSVGAYGEEEELLERDLTEFALEFPRAHDPGTAWNYSSLDSQLISAIFQQAMGESLEDFAAEHLFEPLNIEDYRWQEDGAGTTVGGSGLYLRPRDMAKLGFLYLHQGQWAGEQIVPAEWVELSLTPQDTEAFYEPTGQSELIEWYGYHWWTWKGDWFYGYRAFQAKGFAGQQILVLPEIDLIVVTTANADGVTPEIAGNQEETIATFVHDSVLPLLAEIEIAD